jgi:hypothetical protein
MDETRDDALLRSGSQTDSDIADLAAQLLKRLSSDNGAVTVLSPDRQERKRYRCAIYHLSTQQLVPDGFVIRHTGRDSGDLSIRLVAVTPDRHYAPEPQAQIEVPSVVGEFDTTVMTFAQEGRLSVTHGTTQRALRILQAIANQCILRGWTLEPHSMGHRWLRINTNERSIGLSLTEVLLDQEVPIEASMPAKYGWQRVPMKVVKLGSGRLTLRLEDPHPRRSWSDRRGSKLDDKLGDAFEEMERRVSVAVEWRLRREDDLRRRQQAWDAASLVAKQQYIFDINRQRLHEQITNHAEAQTMREFARRLRDVADSFAEVAEAATVDRWAAWVRDEAERIDPVNAVESLCFVEPEDVQPADFGKFMPKGMNAVRPTQ